jgi:NAD(P)-dependent dehydrogenase (short-subunit alcohol dehydrogenase family)
MGAACAGARLQPAQETAMDLQLHNKVVLITGGSKGIGLACARGFLAEGARVAIASRNPAHLHAAVALLRDEGHQVLPVVVDLCDAAQALHMADAVAAQLGPVQVLVTSAGAARRTPPAELTAAHWAAAMQAKYFTTIHALQAVLPQMAARGEGAVVNIIGMGGKLASPIHLPGGAANAALMLATAGLGHAHAARGVRVNAVNPGLTDTERLQEGLAAEARLRGITPEAVRAELLARLPLGRIARPDEVADVVVFLASARASHVNGATVSLDGGATPTVV